jgi:hypothetical protein
MKQIVVVYSHSGAAYVYAEAFAKQHNADLFRIEPKFEPKGFFAYVLRGYQATFRKPVRLKPDQINLKHYEHMTIVAPIHAGKVSAPVRSYMFSHRTYLPKVDIVLTHGAKDNEYREAAENLETELKFKFNSINSVTLG